MRVLLVPKAVPQQLIVAGKELQTAAAAALPRLCSTLALLRVAGMPTDRQDIESLRALRVCCGSAGSARPERACRQIQQELACDPDRLTPLL